MWPEPEVVEASITLYKVFDTLSIFIFSMLLLIAKYFLSRIDIIFFMGMILLLFINTIYTVYNNTAVVHCSCNVIQCI